MRCPIRNDRGIALFLVLWILMLLSVIVGEFCYTMRTEVNIVRNFKEETQSYYIAKAGITIGINELLKILSQPPAIASRAESQEEGTETPWRVNQAMPPFLYGGGSFRIRISDEGGKVNINRAGPRLLRVMLSGFDLSKEETDSIVDAIQDWRDGDNLHRLNGAEEDYYQSLPEPYHVKNGDFSSPAELMLVRGITPEIFDGGLKDMITVFPASAKNPASSGSAVTTGGAPFNYDRIDVNAAPRALLKSMPEMTDELVDAVISHREATEFRSRADLISVLGADVYGAVSPYLAIQRSTVYAVTAIGYASAGEDGDGGSDWAIQRGVSAVVEIAPNLERPFRVLQWLDNLGDVV